MQVVTVMDFNVHPKRVDDPCFARGSSRGTMSQTQGPVGSGSSMNQDEHAYQGSYELVVEPSVVPAGETFVNDVLSHLPYGRVAREFSANYSGFMIDDERLVGMKVRYASAVSRDGRLMNTTCMLASGVCAEYFSSRPRSRHLCILVSGPFFRLVAVAVYRFITLYGGTT